MMSGLGHAIYRERRRLTFVTGMAFIAGVLFYARLDAIAFGMPAEIIIGLIYAAVVGPVALLVCVFLPSFRFMVDAVAVSRFLVACFVYAFPGPGSVILASPALTAVIVVGYGVLCSRVMHGRVIRQPMPALSARIRQGERAPARIEATPAQHRMVGWLDDVKPIAA